MRNVVVRVPDRCRKRQWQSKSTPWRGGYQKSGLSAQVLFLITKMRKGVIFEHELNGAGRKSECRNVARSQVAEIGGEKCDAVERFEGREH